MHWEEYYKQTGKRDLPIPGVISDDAVGWIAIVTAEEISELVKNYKELAIDFYGDSGAPLDTLSKMPVMSDRVVSYQRTGGYYWSSRGIVSNADTLKLWFPNDYDEQKEECNYFAIYNTTSSTGSGYLVLADDMVLYSLTPRYGWCVMTADIVSEAMLVCDDKANTFRNNINLNGTYAVPSWDGYDWETGVEKGYF